MSAATNIEARVPIEVVIVDAHTAEPIGVGTERGTSTVSDAELFQAETKTPDGPAAMLHEDRVWPRLAALLALASLLVVGVLLYARDGWGAAMLGMVWLGMGYAVACIVVWAAGMARAREEHEIERELEQRNRQE